MDSVKRPVGRPRTKPKPIRLTADQQTVVKVFLAARHERATGVVGELRKRVSKKPTMADVSNLKFWEAVESVCSYLNSTLNQPVAFSPVER